MTAQSDRTAAWPERDESQYPNGYVYVIEFTGNSVKVGRSDDPHTRLRAHERDAAKFGRVLQRAWVSPLHGAWIANEALLITEAERIGARLGGREYFQCSYDAIVGAASRLNLDRITPTPKPADVLTAEPRLCKRVATLTATRARRQTEWREAILAAKTAGVPVVEIAAAAGITRERVYQIEREEAR